LGLPVTTDPDVIATFLRRRGRRVVFATYQSSPQVAAAYQSRTPQFDLAVADEAHRCAGRASSESATILDGERIRSRLRLYMTATPRFYTPRLRHESGLLDVEVASMDDESAFGPVLHRLTFGEAIERELLSDYQVVVVGVDNEMYRAWAERGEFVTPDGVRVTDARTLAGQIALAKAMRKYNLRRVISFHSRVDAARKFSEDMPYVSAWMPARARPRQAIWSDHVSGAMTSGDRDRVLLRFRNLDPDETGLLSNAPCLGEGVDVPTLDGVAFIDPRRSTIDIIQAVGRAIRKAPDKTLGTIVLPVLVGGEDPEQVLDDSAFDNVWDVLKALRAHDEKLGEELDGLRRNLGARRAAPRRPGKIKLDLPRSVGPDFVAAFDVHVVEHTTASWEFWFGLLTRYAERPGVQMPPPVPYTEDGFALGDWVRHQRAAYRRGVLAQERANRLAKLLGWTWDARPLDAWDIGLRHFVRFVGRHGHGRVPQAYTDDEDGYPTGKWASTQRVNREGLSAHRRRRLDSTAHWMWAGSQWDVGFDRLALHVRQHGHSYVRAHETDGAGFRLGRWISRQRAYYKNGNLEALPAHRISQLNALEGWRWDWRDAREDAERLAS
jgi:hypothetical protein